MAKAKKAKAEKKEVKIEASGIENKIIELAKQGLTSEKIGLELKKQRIFTKSALNKKIGKILKESKHYIHADLQNTGKIVERLKKHLASNKHDYPSKRALLIKEAAYTKLKNTQ